MTAASDATVVIVLTTLGGSDDPAPLARRLVDERLAACVNVLPVMTSFYRWKGSVEQEREQQVIIKTTAGRLDALQARLLELHPYEVPEILVVPIDGGSSAYLTWLKEAVADGR